MKGMKFHPVAGKQYKVINTKFTNTDGMMSGESVHEFSQAFPCYDARFHGAGNPDDYIVYQFRLPKQFGIVSFFQFQIKELVAV